MQMDNLAAHLDDNKCASWDKIEARGNLFEHLLTTIFQMLGGDMDLLRVVQGADFQCSREYMLNLYRLSSSVSYL